MATLSLKPTNVAIKRSRSVISLLLNVVKPAIIRNLFLIIQQITVINH